MAERPSVKDILAAARKGGAAKPASDAPVESPVESESPEAEKVSETVENEGAAASPTPADLGRPLTLAEKLAAARAGGNPAAAKPVAKPAAAKQAESGEKGGAAAKVVPAAKGPTPSELGRPLTLAEKLAAARGGAAASTAAAKPTAAKPTAAKPAATAKSGAVAKTTDRPIPPLGEISEAKDLAEAARRTAVATEKAAAPAAAPAKPAPPKPTGPKTSKDVPAKPSRAAAFMNVSRRSILALTSWVAIGWIAFTAGVTAFSAMLGRFMFPNVLAEPPSTIKVGPPNQFEKGEVNERWKGEWGFWIVRSDAYDGEDKIYALSTICTHLGCPPNWLAGEQKFKCPCHGSGFYISGVNFEGPAPRPLERYKVLLSDDGQLVVDKSQKYQEELNQWSDPESYIVA